MTTITSMDMVFSLTCFFMLGVFSTLIIQGIFGIFADRRKHTEDKLDRIEKFMKSMHDHRGLDT